MCRRRPVVEPSDGGQEVRRAAERHQPAALLHPAQQWPDELEQFRRQRALNGPERRDDDGVGLAHHLRAMVDGDGEVGVRAHEPAVERAGDDLVERAAVVADG